MWCIRSYAKDSLRVNLDWNTTGLLLTGPAVWVGGGEEAIGLI